jgi:hypothetical protein
MDGVELERRRLGKRKENKRRRRRKTNIYLKSDDRTRIGFGRRGRDSAEPKRQEQRCVCKIFKE